MGYKKEYNESGIGLEAKLKSIALVEARKKLNISAKKAAKNIGISYIRYINYEAMKTYPNKEVQNKICSYYRGKGIFLLEEDTFPKELNNKRLNKRYVDEEEIPLSMLSHQDICKFEERLILNYREFIERTCLRNLLKNILSTIPKKEENILILSYSLFDSPSLKYKDIGRLYSLSSVRIYQIQKNAIRMLKREKRKQCLAHHTNDISYDPY